MADSVLVTGAAGFIGYHVARRLLENGRPVVGLDNMNSYYDPRLKEARRAELAKFPTFRFIHSDIADRKAMTALFAESNFPIVVHLAAQAGVRHSVVNPQVYIDSNLQGFINILEGCRHSGCQHLLFASSSSVYGANKRMPLSIHDGVDHPISLYGATKRANELMAHAYSHLFAVPATGLRFFTAYGPWGRPDMAIFTFSQAILEGRPIQLFNYGKMRRDFTYIDDVTETVLRLMEHAPTPNREWSAEVPDPAQSAAPWRIFNIGNNCPVDLLRVVELLEIEFDRKAVKQMVSMQAGDVTETCADVEDLAREIGFRPTTPIEEGIRRFAAWFRAYHAV